MKKAFCRALATVSIVIIPLAACTGGEETRAQSQSPMSTAQGPAPKPVNVAEQIHAISPAIPLYEGASFRPDLTRRDNVAVDNEFGKGSSVYTLTTSDAFPQVWHYYVTYLAQFRAWHPVDPYPPSNQISRSIQIRLNEAMKDPFIPGDSLSPNDPQVVLQVAEAESGNGSVIRYIVSPPAPAAPTVASAGAESSGQPATTSTSVR